MSERFTGFVLRRWVMPTLVGIAAFSGGATLGYILGKRQAVRDLKKQIDEFKEEKEAFTEFAEEARTDSLERMRTANNLIIANRNESERPHPEQIVVVKQPNLDVVMQDLGYSSAAITKATPTQMTAEEQIQRSSRTVYSSCR